MSVHQFFKRKAVDPQVAQRLQTLTLPAPVRGLVMNENASFIQPGAAISARLLEADHDWPRLT